MKYLSLLAMLALTGCQTADLSSISGSPEFSHISVTDLQGEPISDWIAEGRVKKVPGGYLIKALERRTPPPHPTQNRFPNGRPATVVGPNITIQEIDKPDWVHEMEAQ